jgi:homoserine O-acetyltransferase/O-succinyltransferase
MIGHVTYLSDESMREKFGRRLHRSALSFDFTGDFQVESYLHHQGKKFVNRFDANSLLYITKAADYFDLERGGGNLLVNETWTGSPFWWFPSPRTGSTPRTSPGTLSPP